MAEYVMALAEVVGWIFLIAVASVVGLWVAARITHEANDE